MSDILRRLWEEQERLERLRRVLGPDFNLGRDAARIALESLDFRSQQLGQAVSPLPQEFGLVARLAEDAARERIGIQQLALGAQFTQERMIAERMAEEAARERRSIEQMIASGAAASSMSLYDQHTAHLRQAEVLSAAGYLDPTLYRFPAADEAVKLFEANSYGSVSLTASAFGLKSQDILHRMGAMTQPWLNAADPALSVAGYAGIQGIGAALRSECPYAGNVSSIIRDALGDWRGLNLPEPAKFADPVFAAEFYIAHGFNIEIADFTIPAYEESMESAGFRPLLACEDELGELELSLRRNNAAQDVIQRVEYHVRRFLEKKMEDAFGSAWFNKKAAQRVKDSVAGRLAKEVTDVVKSTPPLDFADFGDLWLIMEPKDHWPLFAPHFPDKEDAKITFRRLLRERNPVSHTRFIGNLRATTVRCEGSRVLIAIGVYDDLILK